MYPLSNLLIGNNIIELQEVSSTSNYAAELLKSDNLPEGTAIVAYNQTSGRGQRGNSWESEEGSSLTFSLVFYPKFLKVSEQFYLSQAVSLALIDFLNEIDIKATIKWPNDIYIEDAKLGGILIENVISGNNLSTSIVGIGLNLNQKEFPSYLPNPVSLWRLSGKDYPIKETMLKIFSHIERRYLELRGLYFSNIKKAYMNNLYRNDGIEYSFDLKGEQLIVAKINDVMSDGRLSLVAKDNKAYQVNFQEVKFL